MQTTSYKWLFLSWAHSPILYKEELIKGVLTFNGIDSIKSEWQDTQKSFLTLLSTSQSWRLSLVRCPRPGGACLAFSALLGVVKLLLNKVRAFHPDSGLTSRGSQLVEVMPTNFYGTIDTHLVDIVEILLILRGLLRTPVKELIMRGGRFFWSTAVQALWVYPSFPNLSSMD